jgi:aminomethyltransferase
MKETELTAKHIALGAKMAPFAGYNMPISYAPISEEHECVRKNAGVFDVSHMGEFIIKGPEALDLIQRATSNDASKLSIGQAQYSCLPNDDGGIVDDLIVYKLEEEKYLLVVNASNIEKDWNWITRKNIKNADMENISDDCGLLAVQGPNAASILQKLTTTDLGNINFYHFEIGKIADIEDVIISATGYTGSGGFELYVKNKDLGNLWDKVLAAGEENGIKPIGLGARDTLRLEMGYCLYGNDINDETSPIEAGLGWITKLKKPSDFSSRDFFAKQKEEGVEKKLIGFKMSDRRVPRHGYKIVDAEENEIGEVTSGTQSPSLGIPIGMGYVTFDNAKTGEKIGIVVGKKVLEAEIFKPPFYKV